MPALVALGSEVEARGRARRCRSARSPPSAASRISCGSASEPPSGRTESSPPQPARTRARRAGANVRTGRLRAGRSCGAQASDGPGRVYAGSVPSAPPATPPRARSSTRARAASARRASPPPPPAAAPRAACGPSILSTDPAHSLGDSLGGRARPRRPTRGRRAPLGAADRGAARDGGELGRGPGVARPAARRPRRDGRRRRGADRPAGHGRALQPAADPRAPRVRRLRRDHRRLRPDRRDAAAALLPRRRPLVARQGRCPGSGASSRPRGPSPARSSTCRCPTRTSSATSSGWSAT